MHSFEAMVDILEEENATIVCEHCKEGVYFRPFNMLQIDILADLYRKHLENVVSGFEDIETKSNLIAAYFDNLPKALYILGDILCKRIPNSKVLVHTKSDVDKWSEKLFDMLVKNGEL